MKIYTAKQLYEADKATVEKQEISPIDLMERAASQAFEWLDHKLQGANVPVHIFCGIGNNGGDGLALGRMLIHKGYDVKFYVVNYSDKRSKCFLINYDRVKNISTPWPHLMKGEGDFPEMEHEDIIIDAIFGIGLNKPVAGWVKSLIMKINASRAFVLSIDVPSGMFIDAPTPDKEAVIHADFTLTFQAPKLVFFLPETAIFSKNLEVLNIGLDAEYLAKTETDTKLIYKPEARMMYRVRDRFSHKGTYGHSLIIGGSYGKMGAVTLAATSCLRAGAGKVSVLIPQCGYDIVQVSIPEAMVQIGESQNHLTTMQANEDITVIGAGPGLGMDQTTVDGFLQLLKSHTKPIVIDADALNILAKNKKALADIPPKSVLTPHPGELERLIGKWKNDFDKLEKVKKLSKKYDLVFVLKGYYTITVYQHNLYINTTGNPGMATAGSGDVLTGIITGLISQGYDSLIAAVFGVYLHGFSGDLAARQKGYNSLIASDITDNLGEAFISLFSKEKEVEQGS